MYALVLIAVVDLKPANMEDLSEVITVAKCHPSQCNIIGYGSSRGVVKLLDTRQSSLCDTPSAVLQDIHDTSTSSSCMGTDAITTTTAIGGDAMDTSTSTSNSMMPPNTTFFSEMLGAVSDFT